MDGVGIQRDPLRGAFGNVILVAPAAVSWINRPRRSRFEAKGDGQPAVENTHAALAADRIKTKLPTNTDQMRPRKSFSTSADDEAFYDAAETIVMLERYLGDGVTAGRRLLFVGVGK